MFTHSIPFTRCPQITEPMLVVFFCLCSSHNVQRLPYRNIQLRHQIYRKRENQSRYKFRLQISILYTVIYLIYL